METERDLKVIPDNQKVAELILDHYGDKAWVTVIEFITNVPEGSLNVVPFWRGVLNTLKKVEKEREK